MFTASFAKMNSKQVISETTKKFNAKMEDLATAEKKYKKVCEAINVLDSKLDSITVRYERANAEQRKGFRYNIRLKLAVFEGMRASYYEYACLKGQEILNIRAALQEMIATYMYLED